MTEEPLRPDPQQEHLPPDQPPGELPPGMEGEASLGTPTSHRREVDALRPPPALPRKRARRLRPELWVSLSPNGLGHQKPNHYLEMAQTIWENRHAPRYAWRVLSQGVCDGCALGVAGFRDWTIEGVHLCTTRLNLLKVNTMGALDPRRLSLVEPLRQRSGSELRELGRLPYPMLRRRGEARFRRVSWDEAMRLAAAHVRDALPDRVGFYLTARGLTNETYYVAQKVARFLGTNSIDNAARICHAPSTGALKRSIGVAASTCSYTDVIESDLVVLFGADVANAQPVFMKYLYLGKKRGQKVAVVNPYREPGLERYWVPSNAESALFGTRIADDFFPVHVGGDIAFLLAALKVLAAEALLDDAFIRAHTTGWEELRAELDRHALDDLARWAGSSVEDVVRFARMYAAARAAVLVWSMGITQHACGTENVQAIIDLALARGNVGRHGAGLMPIRGHSGVQGGAEMGAYATVFPGGVPITEESAAALEREYGFPVPAERGRSAAEMVEAAGRGELDVLWSSGGNFLDTLPDPASVREALERVPLRVHQDIVVSSQMLVDPGEAVLLLPAATRYEQRDGGTETTTERRVVFSPHIPGHRVGEARTEWEILLDLAHRVDPERAPMLCAFESGQAIREEIARVVPFYDGIQHLSKTGDQVQWGGERLCDGWVFPTPDGKAHFAVVRPREADLPAGRFALATRRGKQFNSMVWKARDPLTGAARDALFLAPSDADRLGVTEGDVVLVRSDVGEVQARVRLAEVRAGNVEMFFPEANPLIAPGRRDPVALIPDYNAVVEIVPLAAGDSPPARAADGRRAAGRDGRRTPPRRTIPAATGVVLAGGRSSRFGGDKLAAELDGRPLLQHAVLAVAAVCREVLVVGPAEGPEPVLPGVLSVPLRVVRDRAAFGGPLAALVEAAGEADQPLLLVVGGDMPGLEPEVLRALLLRARDGYAATEGGDAEAVVLESGGRRQPLPLAIRRGVALTAASDLVASGERSLRSLLDAIDPALLPERTWRRLDPEGRTLRDVDRPEDLARGGTAPAARR